MGKCFSTTHCSIDEEDADSIISLGGVVLTQNQTSFTVLISEGRDVTNGYKSIKTRRAGKNSYPIITLQALRTAINAL